MLLKNQWILEKVKEEMKKYLEKNESEGTIIQNLEDVAKAAKKKVYSNAILPQEIRKTTNNLTLHLMQLEEEEQATPLFT